MNLSSSIRYTIFLTGVIGHSKFKKKKKKMDSSKLLLCFSLFFFFMCFAASSSFNTTKKCSHQQTLALLLFKQNLTSIHSPDDDPQHNSACQNLLSSDYHPIMMNWSMGTDCCKWDGITCNHLTGDVIGIDLSCGMLQGTIHPNTTLFHIPRLQTLNLAYNDFTDSQLPRDIGKSSNSLTHLNISSCGLSGDIPSEIVFLSKLVSLDLSSNQGLKMHPYVLENMLRNSSHLREVVMAHVDIGWVLPTSLNISSSLKSLDLSWTGLQGKLPTNMFSLPYMEKLRLVKQLVPNCLWGAFPKSLFNLTHLTTLNVEGNMLNGTLPSLLFTLPLIENVILGFNLFSGGLPTELFKCRSLKQLILRANQLESEVSQGFTPSLFNQLKNLTFLDLQSNNFKGVWNFENLLSTLPNLQVLDLSFSGLSIVSDNSTTYVDPDFWFINLASCNLNIFPPSLRAMKNLQYLLLYGNNIRGPIPVWAREIGGDRLIALDLSNNSITRLPESFQWDGLTQLAIGSNKIKGPFPPSICNMKNLQYLDLSNNSFDGTIPQCVRNIISLGMINLGTNLFNGTIPNVCTNHGQLKWLILNGNQIEGEIPTSLSKCRDLEILDLGNNHLYGTFPGWLGDLPGLQVIVLKSNNFHGPIETSSMIKFPFPNLRVLDLSHNEFTGQLPRNYFQYFNAMKDVVRTTDSRPTYFEFNGKYYSVIVGVKGHQLPFPQLMVDYMIIDLSSNRFQGDIPDIICTLNSLIVLNISHNNLNGRIPHDIGSLSDIESLDLSWNQLTGEIPLSLADITGLAVLNLSQNRLTGRIPQGKQFNTFDGTSFGGNLELCGFPLPNCGHRNSPQFEVVDGDEEESGFTWKVVMLGYGCGTLPGLLIGYVMLSTGKPKWLSEIIDAVSIGDQPMTQNPSALPMTLRFWVPALAPTLRCVDTRHLFSIENTYDDDNTADYLCQDWLGSGYYPKMTKWNMSTDCYNWGGVTCNQYTGDVIGLDLSCGMLRGIFHPNNTIFHLPHLQSLNLAYNDFGSSSLPHGISRLANSLTHLNISSSLFSGQIPSEISFLPKLVSLDLSWNQFSSELETNVFNNLLRNSTHLSDLLLADVSISVLPKYLNVSSSLKLLHMSSIRLPGHGLHGKLPDNIFDLPFLERLDLSGNYGLTDALTDLALTSNKIQGSFPLSVCNISNLRMLDMSNNFFSGVIPRCFGYLCYSLQMVDLGNNRFEGTIPDLYKDCEQFDGIILKRNQLHGEVPSSFSRCQSLKVLDLSHNNLNGTFPSSLGNLPQLQVLVLKSNKFHGPIESSSMTEIPFPSLRVLDLSQNAFAGNLPGFFGTFKAMQNITKKRTKLKYMEIDKFYYSITLVVKGVLLPQRVRLGYDNAVVHSRTPRRSPASSLPRRHASVWQRAETPR
ncbi:hypothetical protein LXL04_012240 [Taraxacum kok-saghyz]